jgi:hypothetical protein
MNVIGGLAWLLPQVLARSSLIYKLHNIYLLNYMFCKFVTDMNDIFPEFYPIFKVKTERNFSYRESVIMIRNIK